MLRIICNFMVDDCLQLSDWWSSIIGLWWALNIWRDLSTSYKFCGIIHVIYFFQIPVAMNCWIIMSWNSSFILNKKESLCIGDRKVFRFYLKEYSSHIQLIVSFNFELDHQLNCPNQQTVNIIIKHRPIIIAIISTYLTVFCYL